MQIKQSLEGDDARSWEKLETSYAEYLGQENITEQQKEAMALVLIRAYLTMYAKGVLPPEQLFAETNVVLEKEEERRRLAA